MQITAARDSVSTPEGMNFVRCPNCGKILTDVRFSTGRTLLRIKCHRCGKYALVRIRGDADADIQSEGNH